jgi:hypothetical protein
MQKWKNKRVILTENSVHKTVTQWRSFVSRFGMLELIYEVVYFMLS